MMLLCIASCTGTVYAADAKPPAEAPVTWLTYEQGMKIASEKRRFVVVDFYTTWCRDCKKLDKDTFSDPGVVKALSGGFVPVKVDGDKNQKLTATYGVFAYPTVFVLGPDGKKLCQKVGYMKPAEFVNMLEYARSGAYKDKSYTEYVRSR